MAMLELVVLELVDRERPVELAEDRIHYCGDPCQKVMQLDSLDQCYHRQSYCCMESQQHDMEKPWRCMVKHLHGCTLDRAAEVVLVGRGKPQLEDEDQRTLDFRRQEFQVPLVRNQTVSPLEKVALGSPLETPCRFCN